MGQPAARQDESLASLLSSILIDVERLLRQEIALARREVGEQASRLGVVGLWLAGAALLFAFACGLLLLMLMLSGALADAFGWRPWMGHGVVGAGVLVIGVGILVEARRRFQSRAEPLIAP